MDRLEFLDVLLGDRPPLTPVESFYQRMLAGDPDEAHDHAEMLLKDCSLSSYYDEVALKGLQLAVIGTERGALTAEHLEEIKLCLQSLIEDLDEHTDQPPAVGAARGAQEVPEQPAAGDVVLCIAGRGPLDEAVSTMLAQLLGNQGIASRVVPHAVTARTMVGALDVSGVAMVCITYLELSGTPSHLRYLLRRLRQHLPPEVPVLVGLWPTDEPMLQDERLRAAVGADHYTTSLHEAVEACLAVTQKPNVDAPEAPAPAAAERSTAAA